jgi:hypothetical protein
MSTTTRYPVSPTQTPLPGDLRDDHAWEAFGNMETEISAGWIVRFLRDRKGNQWVPFTREELTDYYHEKMREKQPHYCGRFLFNRLTSQDYVWEHDGQFYLSPGFVDRMAKALG